MKIVFGGANYDGEMGMEYFRAFPFIDYVVVGEGEGGARPRAYTKGSLTRFEWSDLPSRSDSIYRTRRCLPISRRPGLG